MWQNECKTGIEIICKGVTIVIGHGIEFSQKGSEKVIKSMGYSY